MMANFVQEDQDVFCLPESYPLKSLSELLSWANGDQPPLTKLDYNSTDNVQCYKIPPVSKQFTKQRLNGSKTLFCHDMMGGYLEDRFNNGHENSDAYRFYYWSLIDIFVYFSHHFITIPPLGWISAAHQNGVRCFGTLIVEGWAKYQEAGDGDYNSSGDETTTTISGTKLLQELVKDEQQIRTIVSALVNIAKYFHFDGWLINIEAPFEQTSQIGLMKQFLTMLTNEMHRQVSSDEIAVIWYDSVTNDNGQLQWQNALNQRNVEFFNCCDGIFLNYCWSEKHLQTSREFSQNPDRRCDVFVGVDVFGRGCFGGGGWNCCTALEMIHRMHLSVALFAPGWTYESLHDNKKREFPNNEFKFWHKLSPWLVSNEKLICQFPLESSFCQGYGNKLYSTGRMVSDNSWFDLKQQQLQPSFWFHPIEQSSSSDNNYNLPFSNCSLDSYRGGSCLQVRLPFVHGLKAIHLFRTKLPIDFDEFVQNNIKLYYSIVYKLPVSCNSSVLKTIFHLIDINNPSQPISIELIGDDSGSLESIHKSSHFFQFKKVTNNNEEPNNWIRNEFELEISENCCPSKLKKFEISSIEIGLSDHNYSKQQHTSLDHILIGEICLKKI